MSGAAPAPAGVTRMRQTLAGAGTITVDVDGRDKRAAELLFPKVVGAALGTKTAVLIEAYPLIYGTWLAWHAAHRTGAYPGAFDAWNADAVGDAELVATSAEPLADPTSLAP